MSRNSWDRLLSEIRAVHCNTPRLQAFCPFPDDVTPQKVTPFHINASDLMQSDPALISQHHTACTTALRDCASQAHWRQTYKNSGIDQDFMDRFGCYTIIGPTGPFHSEQMRAWVVYMPAQLWYPFHHHPGEEMYLTLAGQAQFLAQGEPDKTMTEGDTSHHKPNQPHATRTEDTPFLAYVVWRNGFDVLPVLTPSHQLQ